MNNFLTLAPTPATLPATAGTGVSALCVSLKSLRVVRAEGSTEVI